MTDYSAAVNAGIQLLDAERPGWKSEVDLDNLDLGSCGVCVLGQIFGEYSEGLSELGISVGSRYGFDLVGGSGSYLELTKAWKDALGTNNVLVEKDDVYKDSYGYAVKVLQTHIVSVDGNSITTYIVQTGAVNGGGVFTPYNAKSVSVLLKTDFETTYKIKVEKFTPKKGMFVTNQAGKNFYMVSDTEVREIVHGAYSRLLEASDRVGMKEMLTGPGHKFSSVIVK